MKITGTAPQRSTRHHFDTIAYIGIIAFGLLLTGALSPPTIAAQGLFRSNPAAMRLEPITQGERNQHRYVIQIARTGGGESERFFDNGKLIHETQRLPGPAGTLREQEYRSGELVAVRLLDSEERQISEELFSEGELIERREFRYSENMLVETLIFDAGGELARRDELTYGPKGRVRKVRTIDSSGKIRDTHYAALDGRLLEEYHEGLRSDIRVRYDEHGRTIDEVEYVDSDRRVSTYYTYDSADDRVPSRIRELDHEHDRETVWIYTTSGDILEEREYQSGSFQRGFAYMYRNELLVEREGLGLSAGTREFYEYNEDDELQEVRYLINDELQRERRYVDADEYIDVFYRGGDEVLRTYYRDDRRLREEVRQDGRVVRTREFE